MADIKNMRMVRQSLKNTASIWYDDFGGEVRGRRINMVLFEERKHGNLYQVVRTVYRGEFVQLLLINGIQESAMFPEEERRDELLFPYMKCFAWAMMEKPDIRRALLIGGGGFSYPRYFLRHYPDKYLAVAEASPEVIKISRRFFDLDRLERDCKDRFLLIEGDGFQYLKNTKTCFELVINDAFSGSTPVGNTERDVADIADSLPEDGIYMVNLVSAVRGARSRRRVALTEILKRHFPEVSFMACEDDRDPREVQNCILLARKRQELGAI